MHETIIKIDRAIKYTEKNGKHIFKNALVNIDFLVTMCTSLGSNVPQKSTLQSPINQKVWTLLLTK